MMNKILNAIKIKAINKALGIRLYNWQIQYIFHDKEIPIEIEKERATGTTTARAIKFCIKWKEVYSINYLFTPRGQYDMAKYKMLAGGDNISSMRLRHFISVCSKVFDKLKTYSRLFDFKRR